MTITLSVSLDEFHTDLEGIGTFYRVTLDDEVYGDGRDPGEAFQAAFDAAHPSEPETVEATPRARRKPAAKAKRRSPSPRGKARDTVIAAVRAQPGVTTRQIAEASGLPVESLYRAVKQLENDDLVVKDGRGLHAVVAQDDAEAA